MKNEDLLAVWEQIRVLHDLIYHLGVSIEGLKRTCEEKLPGYADCRLQHEQAAFQHYASMHELVLYGIDVNIRKLKGS